MQCFMAKIKMKQHANTYEVLTNAGFTPSTFAIP